MHPSLFFIPHLSRSLSKNVVRKDDVCAGGLLQNWNSSMSCARRPPNFPSFFPTFFPKCLFRSLMRRLSAGCPYKAQKTSTMVPATVLFENDPTRYIMTPMDRPPGVYKIPLLVSLLPANNHESFPIFFKNVIENGMCAPVFFLSFKT